MDGELLRKCIHLLVTNRSLNSILTILLDFIVHQTGNKFGLIGERKINNQREVFYRYHAFTQSSGSTVSNSNFTAPLDYLTKGYFDLSHEHLMHKDINIGEIYINNTPKVLPGHPPIEKTVFLPLHDTEQSVIGVLGLSGPQEFTREIADSYKPYVEMCSYILQLAIEKNSINHHKTRFLFNVGNALKNPIDGILNVSKMTNSIQLTAAQKQYIDAVTFYSIKLLDLVNDIQDYTKMLSGTLNLVNKTMNLKQCLDTVILIAQQKADQNVTVNLEVDLNLPTIVVADEVRLTQLLVNLLDNSCKFTKRGQISLSVRLLENAHF